MSDPAPFRTLHIDYVGPPVDDDLIEALIDLVMGSGRHVDGLGDGPQEPREWVAMIRERRGPLEEP